MVWGLNAIFALCRQTFHCIHLGVCIISIAVFLMQGFKSGVLARAARPWTCTLGLLPCSAWHGALTKSTILHGRGVAWRVAYGALIKRTTLHGRGVAWRHDHALTKRTTLHGSGQCCEVTLHIAQALEIAVVWLLARSRNTDVTMDVVVEDATVTAVSLASINSRRLLLREASEPALVDGKFVSSSQDTFYYIKGNAPIAPTVSRRVQQSFIPPPPMPSQPQSPPPNPAPPPAPTTSPHGPPILPPPPPLPAMPPPTPAPPAPPPSPHPLASPPMPLGQDLAGALNAPSLRWACDSPGYPQANQLPHHLLLPWI